MKKIWNIVLSAGMLLSVYCVSFPQSVKALETTCGGLYVVFHGGIACDAQKTYLTIMNAGDYEISNVNAESTSTYVVVKPDPAGEVTITLNGVNIDNSTPNTNQNPAMQIINTSTTTITLADGTTNTLKAGNTHAGLENHTSPLVIDGTGSLIATGGYNGAGIGGVYNDSHGAADQGDGSNITIKSGTIYATSGNDGGAAGIGGGLFGKGLNITIDGGEVHATAKNNAAGIGGGQGSEQHPDVTATVTINGGTVFAESGTEAVGGAGIGSGLGNGTSGTVVTINGGTVTATGGNGGDGIGEGQDSSQNCTLNFYGGTIIAKAIIHDSFNDPGKALTVTPSFGKNKWYKWRKTIEQAAPTGDYTSSLTTVYSNDATYRGVEFTADDPVITPTSAPQETNTTPGPFVVTFLDCSGNTVSVQSVPYQGSAAAPSSNYSNYTNISENKDIKPNSCTVGYTVPNTADKTK